MSEPTTWLLVGDQQFRLADDVDRPALVHALRLERDRAAEEARAALRDELAAAVEGLPRVYMTVQSAGFDNDAIVRLDELLALIRSGERE